MSLNNKKESCQIYDITYWWTIRGSGNYANLLVYKCVWVITQLMPEDLFETLTLSLSIVLAHCKHSVDPNIVASCGKNI
jgi:hypothetical protein